MSPGEGGVDNYVLALLDALQGHGHEGVLLFEQNSSSLVGATAAARGIKAIPLPLQRHWYLEKRSKKYAYHC